MYSERICSFDILRFQLNKEQVDKLEKFLNEYKKDLDDISKISVVREKLLTVISTIFGEKSSEFMRCRDIGFSSWTTGGYTEADRTSFIQLIDGILDTLEIIG